MEELKKLAKQYNNQKYFERDPIIFPKHFKQLFLNGEASLIDIEISALLCSYLAWGKREMIIRNCTRLMEEMNWQPHQYVNNGDYKTDPISLHRTIKWSTLTPILNNLKEYYKTHSSLEQLSVDDIRTQIFGQKPNPKAANKKIHMMRRWMVRDDGIVDLGLWKSISPDTLIIPLDTHVHRNALELGITKRKSTDLITALEITNYLKTIFPKDPCIGDFALFAYTASNKMTNFGK